MKLYRRKPSYAMAMPVRRDKDLEDEYMEYAVQPCDESGKPLTSHMEFLTEPQFTQQYETYRVRNRPKPKPSRTRNGPTKNPTKKEMLTIVNLKDVTEESEPQNA